MKTTIKLLFIFAFFVTLLGFGPANAQVYTASNYYYNNFDDGQLGTGFTQMGSTPSLAVTSAASPNNLTIENGYSLSSIGNGVAGGFNLSFLPNNTNLNDTEWGYEWTFLYRNNGGNTDNSDVIDNGENSWKYWLMSDNANVNLANGYFLTQNGSSLIIRYRHHNNGHPYFDDLVSYSLSNNVTYAIRIQRSKRGSQYIWMLFVDQYTTTDREARTRRGNISYHNNQNLYRNSSIMASSTSANRFVFDEMKAYSMKLLISGANDASNGISNPLYAGQQNAVLYGLQMQTRGFFDMYQFKIELTGNITSVIDNSTVKLKKSFDGYFGNADDTDVFSFSSGDVWNAAMQYYGNSNSPFSSFWSVGNADGSMASAGYYFITANVKASPNTSATFAFNGAPLIKSGNTEANYPDNVGTVVNPGTGNSNSGNIKDWTGNTSIDWNTAGNWSPSGVPGANDLARIGVNAFTSNRHPAVSSAQTVGNIILGNATPPTLTVNAGYTLTVNSGLEIQTAATITGAGTIDVKGTFLAKPSATPAKITTSTIGTLNAVNLLLNSATAAVTFNANGANTLIKNSLQTSGTNASTYTLGNGATLTLQGANPFSLSGNYTVNFTNGTVVYGASVQQDISTAFSYKNITFSGAGTKKIASGSLNVSGDWNSAGGRVDLLSNSTTVAFNGTTQAINDAGSDSGNGVFFGNVLLSGGTKTLSSTGKFAVAVGKYLTLGTSTTLQTADNLTLKASVVGSASVSLIPSSSSVQGLVTVEKYIQGGNKDMWRTHRMLSSPVYDKTENGNRKYSFTQFIDDMIITGKGGAANGFDINAGNVASAWTYVSGKGFVEIPTINTSINAGMGAYIFFRGDRSNIAAKVTSPFVDAESTVMTFKGTLNQQDVSVPLAAANLVGNPYAATIDWHAVTKTANVSSVIRVWNPKNRQYSTYNGNEGVNDGTRYIGPGQSFFVQTTGGSSESLTFTEATKMGNMAQASPLYNIVMSVKEKNITNNIQGTENSLNIEEQPSKIRIKLLRANTENSDETLIVLKRNELATVSGYDVTRMGGEAVFLSSLSADGKQMAINYMPHVSMVPSVKLAVNVDNSGHYTMSFALNDVPVGYEAKLKDNYLSTITDLNTEGVTYAFSVDKSVAASSGTDRFEILLAPQTTLPVTFSEFTGNKVNEGVLLKWKTSSEENNSHFEIHRAGDEKIYTSIGKVAANASGIYSLLDKAPLNGNNYYKLVQVDKDGKLNDYPNLVAIKYELNMAAVSGVLVYPTIVEAGFTLKYNGALTASRYLVRVSDLAGKTVLSQDIDKTALDNGYSGVLSSVAPGIYFAELIDASSGKKLGASKLIKK